MKTRIIVLSILAVATIFVIAQSLPISRLPNTATPNDSDLFVLAQTQAPATNKNIRYDQLRGAIRSGLATEAYVNFASNFLAANAGFARLEVQTNSTRLGLVTNLNWTYGMTGSVSSTTAILGVDDSFANNALSNSLWTTITNTSNFIATSSIDVKTNQTMMVLQQTPIAGSQWYVGTNGTPTTNEARSGLEFNAFWRSLRMGEVAGGGDIYGLVGDGSNNWNNTNIGACTAGLGSNAFVKAAYSSVLGGQNNAILTNAINSVIGGGINNLIDTNAVNSVIAGGGRNSIRSTNTGSPATLPIAHITISGGSNNNVLGLSKYATIGGGGNNTIVAAGESTIAGGFANTIFTDGRYGFIGSGNNNAIGNSGGASQASDSAVVAGGSQNVARGDYTFIGGGFQNQMFTGDDYCTIGGGQLNKIGITPSSFSTHATIGGGSSGLIENDSHYSVIGGGLRNTIRNACTNSTIAGGEDNEIQANAPFGNILGGRDNTITGTGDYGTIIGFSNQVSAEAGIAIGRNVTNATANAVMVSELVSYNTPAVISGAGSGSTNYLLTVNSPKMLLGSSNVNIYGVSGTIAGKTHNWSVNITNLSADTWGITFASGTNRWKFQSYMYGTNAPSVLTNNTLLRLNGESEGTNTLVTYEYFAPGL